MLDGVERVSSMWQRRLYNSYRSTKCIADRPTCGCFMVLTSVVALGRVLSSTALAMTGKRANELLCSCAIKCVEPGELTVSIGPTWPHRTAASLRCLWALLSSPASTNVRCASSIMSGMQTVRMTMRPPRYIAFNWYFTPNMFDLFLLVCLSVCCRMQ